MPNPSQRKERVILLMMVGVLLALIVFFSSLMVQTYREYKNFRVRELRIEAKLTQARKEFEQKEIYWRDYWKTQSFWSVWCASGLDTHVPMNCCFDSLMSPEWH